MKKNQLIQLYYTNSNEHVNQLPKIPEPNKTYTIYKNGETIDNTVLSLSRPSTHYTKIDGIQYKVKSRNCTGLWVCDQNGCN